jgi:hypothetical protein
MGLDQYLTAKFYLSSYDDKEKKIAEKVGKLFPDIDLPVERVTFNVFTWRKSNAIHSWFVEHVQEGNDNCQEYYVDLEVLESLLEIINKILGVEDKRKQILNRLDGSKMKLAKELLPTTSGFFFGDTEYDEYYFEDLENTRVMLEKILNNKEKYKELEFYYNSSW